jgi:hypothetical protein
MGRRCCHNLFHKLILQQWKICLVDTQSLVLVLMIIWMITGIGYECLMIAHTCHVVYGILQNEMMGVETRVFFGDE